MTDDEQQVHAALMRFYDALDHVAQGKGTGPMIESWHHTDRVTSSHPLGDWVKGWEELLATWEVFCGLGREGNGGGTVRDVSVYVYGDMAYTTCVYAFAPQLASGSVAVTNILHRKDGAWKLVHHHADKAPSLEGALMK